MVTYKIFQKYSGESVPDQVVISTSASLQASRIDLDKAGYFLFDRRAHRAASVVPAYKFVADMSADTDWHEPGIRDAQASGSMAIAGLQCTIWTYHDGIWPGKICLTPEGVELRHFGPNMFDLGEGLEATNVAFVTVSPELFEVPKGYTSTLPRDAITSTMRRSLP